MKIEFHDAPPPKNPGRPLDPLLVEFMEALKANPGKWAKFPERRGAHIVTGLRKRGFNAEARNQQSKGKVADIWASWPAKPKTVTIDAVAKITTPDEHPKPAAPAGIVPAPRPPDKAGMGLQCADCDFATDPSHAAELDRHTRRMHDRPIYKTEKVPVKIEAAA
jgi:hypothetical protein